MSAAKIRDRFPLLVSSGYATVTAGSAVLLLVLLMAAGRFLDAADYGRFSFALALTTILETIMDVGLSQVTARAVARQKETAAQLFRHVLGLKLVWVAGALLLLVAITPILRSDPVVIRLCYLLGISAAVRSYLLTARGLLQGLDRFDLEAVVVVADRLLLLILGGSALWGGYGLTGLALAFVAARLLMLFVIGVLLRPTLGSMRPQFDREAWRGLQASALPLGFFMLALNMYNYIDTVILGLMRSDAETGWYAASYRIYEGLTYAPSVLAAVLTPKLSFLFVQDRRAHRGLMMWGIGASAALGVLLGAAMVWGAPLAVTVLFGESYTPAAAPLRVLAGGSVFVFCTWILHAVAISVNLDRRLFVTTVIGLGVNVALNMLLISPWGIRGAAWATVLAEAVTVTLLGLQVRQRLRSN
ncbi:MAG TPA: flippase [Vicinamibacterales bacterium]|nr:flippase [Vicinamibacterales bacterium]